MDRDRGRDKDQGKILRSGWGLISGSRIRIGIEFEDRDSDRER
jgi:hypothetical protein